MGAGTQRGRVPLGPLHLHEDGPVLHGGQLVPTHSACSNHLFGQPGALSNSLLLGEPSHYSSIKNSETDMQVLIAGSRCLKGPPLLPCWGRTPGAAARWRRGFRWGFCLHRILQSSVGLGRGRGGGPRWPGGRGVPSHPPGHLLNCDFLSSSLLLPGN